MGAVVDLNGKKFGRLTAISRAPNYLTSTGTAVTAWLCECDCEKSIVVRYPNLVNGHTCSCGCLLAESRSSIGKRNAKDWRGLKRGYLTMIEYVAATSSKKRRMWRCLCDCGMEKILRGDAVARGQITSCGCLLKFGDPVRPIEIRAVHNAYNKNRRSTNVEAAINSRFGNAIRRSLKRHNSKKTARWEHLLGFTLSNLIVHLQKTMPSGYSWADVLSGQLHIDHKKPLSLFQYSDDRDPQFTAAWSLKNLQLLPWLENIQKGNSYVE